MRINSSYDENASSLITWKSLIQIVKTSTISNDDTNQALTLISALKSDKLNQKMYFINSF